MDRVNGADWVDIGGGNRGFRSQNKAGGITGTEVTAAFLNGVQEELSKVIEDSGQELDDGDWTQLSKALATMVKASGVGWRGMVPFGATGDFDMSAHGLSADDKILVMLWGGGGGGGAGVSGGGAAGSAGGFSMKIMAAQDATVTVGTGGAANTAGGNGGNGGATSFGSVFSAGGGGGGSTGTTPAGAGSGGDVNLTGSTGGDIITGSDVIFSAVGGSAPLMGLNGPVSGTGGRASGGAAWFKSGVINGAKPGGDGFAIVIF